MLDNECTTLKVDPGVKETYYKKVFDMIFILHYRYERCVDEKSQALISLFCDALIKMTFYSLTRIILH